MAGQKIGKIGGVEEELAWKIQTLSRNRRAAVFFAHYVWYILQKYVEVRH